jgi:hypothetical protein
MERSRFRLRTAREAAPLQEAAKVFPDGIDVANTFILKVLIVSNQVTPLFLRGEAARRASNSRFRVLVSYRVMVFAGSGSPALPVQCMGLLEGPGPLDPPPITP